MGFTKYSAYMLYEYYTITYFFVRRKRTEIYSVDVFCQCLILIE